MKKKPAKKGMGKKCLWLVGALLLAPTLALAAASNPANIQNGPANQTESHGSAYFDGGVLSNGSSIVNGIGTPVVGTVANYGTKGSTTYTYYCVGQDVNGYETIPSSSFTTTTGNATLSATNYNVVTCGGLRGAVSYRVLKADASHSLGTCSVGSSGGYCSVTDNTTGAGASYTAQTVDQTQTVASGIQSCGGSVAVTAGTALVTAPCIGYPTAKYAACITLPAGGATPVASNFGNCKPTSTATVIGGATSTVGAVQIYLAGTASATVDWMAGPL